jgi:hypothetical protein
MKNAVLIIALILGCNAYSQGLKDLGVISFLQTKKMNATTPCEESLNQVLTYCVEDGSYISYTFNDYNKLNGIIFLTPYLNQSLAERGLENDVSTFSNKVLKQPIYQSGMAFFPMTSQIGVTFEVVNFKGTYYVKYSTLLSN